MIHRSLSVYLIMSLFLLSPSLYGQEPLAETSTTSASSSDLVQNDERAASANDLDVPVKTLWPHAFVEWHGYFRTRLDLFLNLDLNVYDKITNTGAYIPNGLTYPANQPASLSSHGDDEAAMGGANMRLRLDPIFKVNENVHVHLTLDIFDNMVLGSTPDTYINPYQYSFLSNSQTNPENGKLAKDSIIAKRAWANIITSMGELRFGRMGSHFGMGILENDGNCLDCDGGDTVDRVSFITKMSQLYVIPAFDFSVSGPTDELMSPYSLQPKDADQQDDANQWSITILRKDSEKLKLEKLRRGEMVLQFGGMLKYRTQDLDSANSYLLNDSGIAALSNPKEYIFQINRSAEMYVLSGWGFLQHGLWSMEAEIASMIGSMNDNRIQGKYVANPTNDLSILQIGTAVSSKWRALKNQMVVSLDGGLASGDSDYGFGIIGAGNTAAKKGDFAGPQSEDGNLHGFLFDRNYIIDMILWREIIGTFTDGIYVKPGLTYYFRNGIGLKSSLMYSRALFAKSTMGQDANLGVEGNFALFYATANGFQADLNYGALIPLAGLKNTLAEEPLEPSFTHTLQLNLGIVF